MYALPSPMGPLAPSPHLSPVPAQLKDLKRQLHLERKRADKLQERLQDILTNSKSRSGEAPGQDEKAVVQGSQGLGMWAPRPSCTSIGPALWLILSLLNSLSYLFSVSLLFLPLTSSFPFCFLFSVISPCFCVPFVPLPLNLPLSPCLLSLHLSLSLPHFLFFLSIYLILSLSSFSLSASLLPPHIHSYTSLSVSKSVVYILSFCKSPRSSPGFLKQSPLICSPLGTPSGARETDILASSNTVLFSLYNQIQSMLFLPLKAKTDIKIGFVFAFF